MTLDCLRALEESGHQRRNLFVLCYKWSKHNAVLPLSRPQASRMRILGLRVCSKDRMLSQSAPQKHWLYVCTDDPNEDNRFIAQENNPMKFFQNVYQQTLQIYLRHGKWHNYLLHFSIGRDASFSILHLKRGKASLKKFIIRILGITLPTNHRLNLVQSKIYRFEIGNKERNHQSLF
jgi:hypothetical protein